MPNRKPKEGKKSNEVAGSVVTGSNTYPGANRPTRSSPLAVPHPPSPHQHQQHLMNRSNSESPQCEVVEITSSLTINNVSKYTALARARRKIMFIARKTNQNQLAFHYLKENGRSTPEGIMLKDNQIQVLTSSETTGLLDMAKTSKSK